MDPSSSMTMTNSRQRRVLPSRSRRGGPGVGSCDADVMILETQRRKFENEPLIPTETPFLLTTNASIALASDTSRLAINTFANERYFDKPEVLKSYREQLDIQTPEYLSISDTHVGSRFRVRSGEDGIADTSDAAYEKRHRKYETFEKRQRLREKEKLKHEQYKLKERIDQLRAMDSSAFLTLPASSFSAPPVSMESEEYINGSAAFNEGERRRKEMLDIALMLEERYRVLLPPDRVRKPVVPRTDSVSLEPDIAIPSAKWRKPKEDELISELDQRAIVESSQLDNSKITIKFKVPLREDSVAAPAASIPPPPMKMAAAKKPKTSVVSSKNGTTFRRIRAPPSTPPPTSIHPSPEKSPISTVALASTAPDGQDDEAVASDVELQTPITADELDADTIAIPTADQLSIPDKQLVPEEENNPFDAESLTPSYKDGISPAPPSSPPSLEQAPLEDIPKETEDAHIPVAAPVIGHVEFVKRRGRRPKRPRLSPAIQPNNVESVSTSPNRRRSISRAPSTHSSHKQPAHGALVTAALRSASGGPRTTTKAPRHNTAFGVKLHLAGKETLTDFELPPWILPYDEVVRRLSNETDTRPPAPSTRERINHQSSNAKQTNDNLLSKENIIPSGKAAVERPFHTSPLYTEDTVTPTEVLMLVDDPADSVS